MSFAQTLSNQVTGARRMNLTMLAARDRADGFSGLPRGSAKPLRILAAFQEAEPYLGLPAHAFKLVSWLVKQTQPQDWEEGSRPIAWPSARRQAEFLGLSPTRVKALNRALFEAGIVVMRDDPQGKRWGRRGPDGRIVEAYGFDLTPLAQRIEEFIRVAAAAKLERDRMRQLRRRVTMARRAIRQAGEALALLGPLPSSWRQIEADTAALIVAARQAERSDDLVLIAVSLERRKTEAEQALKAASDPVETDPKGSENGPHITTTNLTTHNLPDTVIAGEACSEPEEPAPKPVERSSLFPERLGLTPGQLVELAPRLSPYVPPRVRDLSWSAIVDAAEWLASEMGVSRSLWTQACHVMGREYAAVALALVSTRPAGHFTSSAGGYFAGMLRKFENGGKLRLAGTLWKLREAKWGKMEPRRRLLN